MANQYDRRSSLPSMRGNKRDTGAAAMTPFPC